MRRTGIFVLAAAWIGLAEAARADVTIESFEATVEYDNDDGNSESSSLSDATARSFVRSVTASQQDTQITVDGDALTILSTARVTGAGDDDYGESDVTIRFRSTVPSAFAIQGRIFRDAAFASVSATVFGTTRTTGVGADGDDVRVETFGALPAGTWTVRISAGAASTSSEVGWDLRLRFCPGVCQDFDFRWKNPRGGRFDVPASWDPEGVPTVTPSFSDVAVFDLPERYTVQVGAQTTERLLVSSGVVTFRDGDYRVPGGDPFLYAIRFRGEPVVTLGPGMTLRGRDAVVATEEDADFDARLVLAAPDARLVLDGLLAVGDSFGAGALEVRAGDVDCGPLQLDARDGTADRSTVRVTGTQSSLLCDDVVLRATGGGHGLAVLDGATVACGDLDLKVAPDPDANVDSGIGVTGSSSSLSSLQVEDLRAGSGFLTVGRLAQLTASGDVVLTEMLAVVAADSPARPAGFDVRGSFTLRGGFLDVVQGKLTCDGSVSLERDGDGDGSVVRLERSEAAFTGANTDALDAIVVGARNAPGSSVQVVNGSRVESSLAGRSWWIGVEPDTVGYLTIGEPRTGGSRVVTGGNVLVGHDGDAPASELQVYGGNRLTAPGFVFVSRSGRVVGGRGIGAPVTTQAKPGGARRAAVPSPAVIECAGLENGGTLEVGDLVIDGDYTQTASGELVASIAGPAAGRDADRLVVTGTAKIDGKLVLRFEGGYAPKAGVAFDLVEVQGGATEGSFDGVEVQGLAPGAQFEASVAGGRLTATAMNDTSPLAAVAVKARGKKILEKRSRKPGLFTFTRTGPVNAPLEVTYAIGGSARNGADYAALPGTVTIPAGAKSATVSVQLVDDRRREGEESVELRVVAGTDYARSRASRATLRVVDND
jgi:hypothetical protein